MIDTFREPLRSHYATIFGSAFCDRAEAIPQAPSDGRIMLRRAGYHLAPHRDPKRSMATCLMYLATKSDQGQFSYQFYVGPGLDDLGALIADLPPERQAMWRDRKHDAER